MFGSTFEVVGRMHDLLSDVVSYLKLKARGLGHFKIQADQPSGGEQTAKPIDGEHQQDALQSATGPLHPPPLPPRETSSSSGSASHAGHSTNLVTYPLSSPQSAGQVPRGPSLLTDTGGATGDFTGSHKAVMSVSLKIVGTDFNKAIYRLDAAHGQVPPGYVVDDSFSKQIFTRVNTSSKGETESTFQFRMGDIITPIAPAVNTEQVIDVHYGTDAVDM